MIKNWNLGILSSLDNTSGSYLSFFIKSFLWMLFLRLPSLIIKEMISVNVTIGVNGHTLFPDKMLFYVWGFCTAEAHPWLFVFCLMLSVLKM